MKYRFTFEVEAGGSLKSSELQAIHAELHKYLSAVVLPVGSTIQTRAKTEVTEGDEVPYFVHKHDGTDRCSYCFAQANDERS